MELNKKIKIAFIINSLKSRNGADVFLINLLTSFKKNKNISFILVSLYDYVDTSLKKQIDENNIDLFLCHKKSKIDFGSSLRLKKILNDFSPDIINMHLSVLVNYRIAFGYKRKNWKLVKTYHSIPGKDLNRTNLYLEKQYCKRDLLSFIGISESISKMSLEIFPHSCTKTIVNGIQLPSSIIKQGAFEYDFIIVASLEEVKNHMLLFRSFEHVVAKHPNAKLAVVGAGTKMEEYKEYVSENHLSNNILFFGQVDDVPYYLKKSKVFVLSSSREGNPISVLEALSYGLPIVAPKVGGIPDIIDDKINGLLFTPGDERELNSCLNEMIEDSDLCALFSKNNIVRSKEYSIDKTRDEYIEFFAELLNDKVQVMK